LHDLLTLRPMAVVFKHVPVLLREVVSVLLRGRRDVALRLVDCTVGGGGHSKFLLDSAPNANLLGIDKDFDAIRHANCTLQHFRERCEIVHSSYEALPALLQSKSWDKVDGMIADLGVSSFQLDSVPRGFGFRDEALLDMRFDQSGTGPTAYVLVNRLPAGELRTIFHTYGEESFANEIASCIVDVRRKQPIKTTRQLADLVQDVYHRYAPPRRRTTVHPATKTFQALRIAVNNELACVKVWRADNTFQAHI
jgi:16S rRNA (cytosine1402-N4)-methyltransferase